jgi:hypothetical protein
MRRFFLLLSVAVLAIGTARADTTYSFSGSSDMGPTDFDGATFTLTVASPITDDAYFTPGGDLTCNMCDTISFIPDFAGYQAITYGMSNGVYYFYFDPGSFTTYGTYESVLLGPDQEATLTVTGGSLPVTATPEPSSFLLLGSGLAGFAGLLRRKLKA